MKTTLLVHRYRGLFLAGALAVGGAAIPALAGDAAAPKQVPLSTFIHPDTVLPASWSAQWIGMAAEPSINLAGASWIWTAEPGVDPLRNAPAGSRFFQRVLELPGEAPVSTATALMTADNHFVLLVNGKKAGNGDSWEQPQTIDIAAFLHPGRNVITVRAENDPASGNINAAGLIGKISVTRAGQAPVVCVTDATWKSTKLADPAAPAQAGDDWPAAQVLGQSAMAPWTALGTAKAGASASNQWTCFRKSFELAAKPASAKARIAVDSKYWVWVNGQLAVREGGLKRGPTTSDTFFDEIDLAPFLQAGPNTVAVLVWFFGKEGFSHNSSGQSGLLFELAAGDTKVTSDASWRVSRHPAFGNTGAPHPNFRLAESNLRFDAGKEPIGWQNPGFADGAWSQATVFGKPDCAPWHRLVRRPVPFWKDYGLKPYVNATALPAVSTGQVIKARLPYNAQVTPYLKIEAKAGQLIKIQMDNYNGGSERNVRAEYVARDGIQEFECPGWMNGHEVHYELPAGIRLLDLRYRETGFDTEFTGTFDCDDDFLNRLRVKSSRTLYITMRETYMDCPDRERALWWGDAVNELGEAFYALDRRSDLLTRKCIIDLIAWQRPDGVLFAPVPTGNWDKDLPLQMLASVGRTGFWTYGLYSGDLATLRTVYPGVKHYLQIWNMQANGLVVPRRGSWEWGDWGDNVDLEVLYNVWYHLALQGMRSMAVELGQNEDLPWIEARLKSIGAAFNPTFWNGREYRAPGFKGKTDDRANALAVVAGLASPEQFPAIIEVLKAQRHASPYMEKYVLEALCLMDQPALAQERMRQRYAKMVDYPGCTTLWEGWGIGNEGFGGGTINHAWSGGPLTIMSQYFAGIEPTSPGFATYRILPRPGTLRQIRANVTTVKGDIGVELAATPDSFSLKLNSPAKTLATVGIPGDSIDHIRINGGPASKAAGVKANGRNGRYLLFEVGPGHWEFERK